VRSPIPCGTPHQLMSAVRERLDDLRLCYQRALRTNRALGGQLTVAVEITPQGWVMPHVRAIDTLADDGDLVRCVEQAASSWRFSRVDGDKLESALIPILFGKGK
jgi:hypothetical protein